MPPTARSTATELDELLSYLIDSEIALHTTSVRRNSAIVSWPTAGASGPFLTNRDHPTTALYRQWIMDSQYSAVLYDGSLLQITYAFDRNRLKMHRLAHVPAPFDMDPDLLLEWPLADVFDTYATGSTEEVLLKGTLRFDFDAARAAPNHPASHLTINSQQCRIACAGPVRIGLFIEAVFRHFYPDLWNVHPYLRSLPKGSWGPPTITTEERVGVHVAWDR